MEFSNYQNQAKRITHYKSSGAVFNVEYKDQMIDRLGCILFAIVTLCYEYDITLETIALRNLAKLRKRQRADSGDDR